MKHQPTKFVGLLLAAAALSACGDDPVITDLDNNNPDPPGGVTTGDEESTFDHSNDSISAWELIDRLRNEGPQEYRSRVHGCLKVRYRTLGTVLGNLGVNMAATGAVSAGTLYRNGNTAMGVADFDNRIRESRGIATSAASRMFDIFAAAAPEIIAAMPNLDRCKTAGVAAQLFDANNACQPSGVACLIGAPPDAVTMQLCNLTVQRASSVDNGKVMAVASILAAHHTCE